jgi:hypothetical protein
METHLVLYRPVGLKEIELILAAECKVFPPRLPEQPYFYPVLTENYAHQIARDWNTKDPKSGFSGFVTQFAVDQNYIAQFDIQTVGNATHRELWIPAEQLKEFNEHIQGHIEIIDAYYGDEYKGIKHWQQNWYADEMFDSFYKLSFDAGQDFSGEMTMNRHAILLNFKYWVTQDYRKSFSTKANRNDF